MSDEELADEYVRNHVHYEVGIRENGTEYAKEVSSVTIKQAFLAGLKVRSPEWHKLDWEKDYPDVDKLIRVRTHSGAEYICETYSYEPEEDEIGYGHLITQFSELNGDWVDDNEVEYWCEIEPFKE